MQLIVSGPPVVTFKESTGTPRVSGPIVILVLALWPVAPRGLLRPWVVAWLFVLLLLVSGTLVWSQALGSMLRGFVLVGRQGTRLETSIRQLMLLALVASACSDALDVL